MSFEAWTEVRAEVPLGWEEFVAELLGETAGAAACIGVSTISTPAPPEGLELVRTYLPARHDTPEMRTALKTQIERWSQNAKLTNAPQLSFRELPAEDFAQSWKKVWKPFRVGRLCLLPELSDNLDAPQDNLLPDSSNPPRPTTATTRTTDTWAAKLRPNDIALRFTPGSSFGSGRHATTRTCLRQMQSLVKPSQHILDAGAGSGLLSVAASLLGAASTYGFDLDRNSEPNATRLAQLNNCSNTRFDHGDFACLAANPGPYDGLFANIYANVLCTHAEPLAAALKPGAWFLLSGIREDHLAETLPVLAQVGLQVETTLQRGRWVTLRGQR